MSRAPGLAFVVLALPALLAAAQERPFRWEGRLAPGQTLEVRGVSGRVTALSADGAAGLVTAAKSGRRSDPSEVEIRVVEHAGGVTICAVYPSKGPRPNDCRTGRETHQDVRNNDVRVDFTVRVPPGARFVGRTVNGDVRAGALRGPVEVYTVNGSVEIGGSQRALAETVNGSITAVVDRADWTGALEFRTVNGGITLSLPRRLDTEVEAVTVNGEILTDYPIRVEGRFGPKRLSGTIGRGGRSLELQTVNGDIRLESAAS